MTDVICWSRKMRIIPSIAGTIASGISHQCVTSIGFITQFLQHVNIAQCRRQNNAAVRTVCWKSQSYILLVHSFGLDLAIRDLFCQLRLSPCSMDVVSGSRPLRHVLKFLSRVSSRLGSKISCLVVFFSSTGWYGKKTKIIEATRQTCTCSKTVNTTKFQQQLTWVVNLLIHKFK